MPLYEHVFLARQDISAQQVDSLSETFRAIITENGGSVGKAEYWGLKGLAYKIKKNRKAHFTLLNIDASHEAVEEMERQMRISTDILRFMTIRVDEHEDGPSPMMKRGDRDDRRGRRGRDDGPPRARDRDRDRGGDADSEAAKEKKSSAKDSDDSGDAGKKTAGARDKDAKKVKEPKAAKAKDKDTDKEDGK